MEPSTRALLLVALAACLPLGGLAAQATTTLAPSDPARRDVDVLVRHGLVRDAVLGQRPLSWREVGRLVDQAELSLDAAADTGSSSPRTAYLAGVVERLVHRVAARAGAPSFGLDDARADLAYLDSPAHGIPDNGLGLIDAVLNPLTHYQDGRVFLDGTTAAVEVGVSGRLTPWLALAARPRAHVGRWSEPDSDDVTSKATFQSLSGRVVLGNAALVVGRDHVSWGPAPEAGALLSRNARALDMVHLANDAPLRLPWLLRHLGPTRLSAFVSNLGQDRNFPGTLLFGFRGSFLPHPDVEVGFSLLNEQGGEGAPEAGFGDRLLDLLFFPDILVPGVEGVFSEKLAGLDARVRVPSLRGLELYLEGAITDFDIDRAREMFWEEAAYTAGALLPGLGERGAGSLRLEAYHVGVRPYRHYQFVTGLTLDGLLLGNALGPDGAGATATLAWEAPLRSWARGGLVELRAALENRSVDLHDVIDEPFFHNIVFLEDRPDERRWRLTAGWTSPHGVSSLLVDALVGVERVEGFGYVAGEQRTNALARLQVGWTWR